MKNEVLDAVNNVLFWRMLLVISAMLVGIIYILPPLLIWNNFNESGYPFVLVQPDTYADELVNYLPRAREVYDGHAPPEGVYAYESGPTIMNPLPPMIFWFFLYISEGDVNSAYILAQFFFSIIIFLLLYLLGRLLSFPWLWSLFFAFVGVLTQIPQQIFNIFNYQPQDQYWGIIFKNFIPIIRSPVHKMYLARIDDPLLTYPILLMAICFFFIFLKYSQKIWAILAGIFSGLLAYTYLHYWFFWTLAIIVAFIQVVLQKDRIKLKRFIYVGLAMFVTLIPYLINYLDFKETNYAHDYILRLGTEEGWRFVLDYPFILLNFIFLYTPLFIVSRLVLKKYGLDSVRWIILSSSIISMFLVWLIPFVIGFMPHLYHFRKPINLLAFIVISTVLYTLCGYLHRIPKTGITVLIILLIFLLVSKKIVNAFVVSGLPRDIVNMYNFPVGVKESWDWMNRYQIFINKEPVIFSPSLLSSLYLVVNTNARPFLATGFISTLPTDELERRFLMVNKLFNIPDNLLIARLSDEGVSRCQNGSDCLPDSDFNLTKDRWYLTSHNWDRTLFLKNINITHDLKMYQELPIELDKIRGNYIYLGPWEKRFSSKQPRVVSRIVFKNPSVAIYEAY